MGWFIIRFTTWGASSHLRSIPPGFFRKAALGNGRTGEVKRFGERMLHGTVLVTLWFFNYLTVCYGTSPFE
jgi:uncharacterized membrane protein SpoIIM required for sporulation